MELSEGTQQLRALPGPWWLARRQADLPTELDWLSPEEERHLARLQVEKKRNDWLLGRWTAKSALRACKPGVGTDTHLADVTVRQSADGAPEAYLRGRPLPLALSISHRRGWGLCVLASEGVLVGCDLELAETRSPAFLEDYFVSEERLALSRLPAIEKDRLATLFWAAKESALKALRVGLRADTRRIRVTVPSQPRVADEWRSLAVQDSQSDLRFGGWNRSLGELTLVVVTSPPSGKPMPLEHDS